MTNPKVLLVVFLGLLSGCGPQLTTCTFDRDCPGVADCVKGMCVDKDDPTKPEPKKDAGVVEPDPQPVPDAGAQPKPDAGVDPVADAGVDAGVDPMTPDAGSMVTCMPRRCSDVGASCGQIPDLCGAMLSCGTCSTPQHVCSPALTCVCVPKTRADFPNLQCSSVSDGCGGTVSLGMCTGAQEVCQSNRCECVPKTPSDFPILNCGSQPDGCGATVSLGACASPQEICQNNFCVCIPTTTADYPNNNCGTVSDGCGGTITFGTCGQFYTCSSNQCVCASSVDDPDDLFQDTNCDGIDGDASKAVFVSAAGNDSNNGLSRNAPVQTLNRAFGIFAGSALTSIFITAGTYAPATVAWPAGLKLYGGYSASWVRSADANSQAIIQTTKDGWALVSASGYLERLIIQSTSAANSGESSHALRLIDCGTAVSLKHVTLIAGLGRDGAAGFAGAAGVNGGNGEAGHNFNVANRQWAAGGLAPGLRGGGLGGAGGLSGQGWSGWSIGSTVGGAGGAMGCPGVSGGNGNTPIAGASGNNGSSGSGLGSVASGLFTPASTGAGQPGTNGLDGYGGSGAGGGGSLHCASIGIYSQASGGGGGGAGGTGGTAGAGGRPGGSSIALVLVRSNPTMSWMTLRTGNTGAGGLAGAGGAGGVGGLGGNGGITYPVSGWSAGTGGRGGNGSAGGRGGDGGNGVGGSSVGIWCDSVTGVVGGQFVNITPGFAGAGGIRAITHNCQ